jgi:type IV pilus biogenesis protein CpaD/CtpE
MVLVTAWTCVILVLTSTASVTAQRLSKSVKTLIAGSGISAISG